MISPLLLTKQGKLIHSGGMKISKRGQVTIPKEIRDRFGLMPNTDVEFHVSSTGLILRKTSKKLDLHKWKGKCRRSFAELGCSSVDEFIEAIRGR